MSQKIYWSDRSFRVLEPDEEVINISPEASRQHNDDWLNYIEQSLLLEEDKLEMAVARSEHKKDSYLGVGGLCFATVSGLFFAFDLSPYSILSMCCLGAGMACMAKHIAERFTYRKLNQAIQEVQWEKKRLADTRELVSQQSR